MKKLIIYLIYFLSIILLIGCFTQFYESYVSNNDEIVDTDNDSNNENFNNDDSSNDNSSSDNDSSDTDDSDSYVTIVNNSSSILYLIDGNFGDTTVVNTIYANSTNEVILSDDKEYYLASVYVYKGSYTINNGTTTTTFEIDTEHWSNSNIYYDSDTTYLFEIGKSYTIDEVNSGTYSITYKGINCTITGATTISTSESVTLTIVAYSGYESSNCTCTVSGCAYTFVKSTGTLILLNPTRDVTVTVEYDKNISSI